MKKFAILFFLFFLIFSSLNAFGQKPKTSLKRNPKPTPTANPLTANETEEFEKAKAISDPGMRIPALQNFIKNFPNSTELIRAQGLIVSARAELAEKKLESGETGAGIELFKLAVAEAPTPVSDELFTRVILGFPLSLYSRDQRSAAFDIVRMIEEKVGSNASQILDLAKFFITIQYGTEAIRLAEKSVGLAPDSVEGLKTLAIAYRLNFRLEDAAKTYAKALELDEKSLVFRQNLAEIKRALGKTGEALALYREILEQDEKNPVAQAGVVLALFNLGQRKEAEAELTKALENNPNNIPLLVGIAYWYASQGEGEKAAEYAQKAIELDQQNVWAYIARSRGLLLQNKPLDAEKVLLVARQHGDFPTLDYELATTRLAAGFYREAAETLKRNFTVNQEGLIETYLGNRILADAESFTTLLSLERQAVLFEKNSVDNAETAQKLKDLLVFFQKLEAAQPNDDELGKSADEFIKGNDNFRLYRQIFVAQHLLRKKVALPKVLELTRAAVGGVDAALNVSEPTAAVLAEDLYATRQFFIARNQMLVVPTLPRQTLSAILRGKIEEIAGQTLYYQNNPTQAIVRLRRALSVLPEKSSWWRSSMWSLGAALEAEGREKEALDAYLKSYDQDNPDTAKRLIIEGLYQKLNGSLDGLDAILGTRPDSTTLATLQNQQNGNQSSENNGQTVQPTPLPENPPNPQTNKLPEDIPLPTPEETPKTQETPSPTPEETPKTQETPSPTPEETPKTQETPSPTPEETPKTQETPSPTPQTEPQNEEKTPVETPTPTPTNPIVEPTAIPTPEILPKDKEAPSEKPTVEPTPVNSPVPQPESVSEKNEENKTLNPETDTTPNPQTVSQSEPKPVWRFPPSPEINLKKTQTDEESSSQTSSVKTVSEPEKASVEKSKEETKSNVELLAVPSGETRPRVVTDRTGNSGDCRIVVSQETLSILANGGSLGVLVGFENEGNLEELTAVSDSPEDIEVTPDPVIGQSKKRVFFIVKSISPNTGEFKVIFQALCGKKEITVRVRK